MDLWFYFVEETDAASSRASPALAMGSLRMPRLLWVSSPIRKLNDSLKWGFSLFDIGRVQQFTPSNESLSIGSALSSDQKLEYCASRDRIVITNSLKASCLPSSGCPFACSSRSLVFAPSSRRCSEPSLAKWTFFLAPLLYELMLFCLLVVMALFSILDI